MPSCFANQYPLVMAFVTSCTEGLCTNETINSWSKDYRLMQTVRSRFGPRRLWAYAYQWILPDANELLLYALMEKTITESDGNEENVRLLLSWLPSSRDLWRRRVSWRTLQRDGVETVSRTQVSHRFVGGRYPWCNHHSYLFFRHQFQPIDVTIPINVSSKDTAMTTRIMPSVKCTKRDINILTLRWMNLVYQSCGTAGQPVPQDKLQESADEVSFHQRYVYVSTVEARIFF